MAVKMSYFIIFGVITITTAKPARDDREDSPLSFVKSEYELQKLLQSLASQGTYDVASNYRQDEPNAYYENRAASSRYDDKPRQSYYYHNDKADSSQYYNKRENADENEPSINSLQIINQLLEKNDDKPRYDNGKKLLEDLVSLSRNNKYRLLKPNDESDNVDEVVAFLGDLQKKVADDKNNRDDYDYGKARGDNLSGKLFLGKNDNQEVSDRVESMLVQPKDRVIKLVENIFEPRYHEPNYVSVSDSYGDRDNLRCSGNNCARTNRAGNDDNNNRLRCRGKNCARTRNDVDDHLKYNTKLSAQTVKLNDDVDAVVLGLSDVEHLLTKLNVPKQPRTNKLRGAKLIENVDLGNLFNSNGRIGEKGNVEAVVFDLTQVENGDAVAKQIKQLLSQRNKEDSKSKDEYEEYGNLVEEHLKEGVYDIGKQFGTGRASSKILPHSENNNNVYLPQWLLDEVMARSNVEKEPVKERKSLFPLTRQQKERIEARKNQDIPRIHRRNIEQDIGVPFHLEVQGLGQVNP